MFTFGREHELKCASGKFKNKEEAKLLLDVVNVIHDYLEKSAAEERVTQVVKTALVEGPSGVWESAGSWLIKLGNENKVFLGIWRELAKSSKANTRFRVGAHLRYFPSELKTELYETLSNDKSKRVREHVIGNWEFYEKNRT